MKTTLFILMALLSSCVAEDSGYQKRLLELTKKLKLINVETKKDLRSVTSRFGSRGLLDNFERVSSALEKVDSFVSTLENGAKSLPFPAVQHAAGYIPMVRTVLKAGRETIDTVMKAQKELANGDSLLSVRNLFGGLGIAQKVMSSVMDIFRKFKKPNNFAENLNNFATQMKEVESTYPRQDFSSAAAQASYASGIPSSSMYRPSSSSYSPGSAMYNPYIPSSSYGSTGSLYKPGYSSRSSNLAALGGVRSVPNLSSAMSQAISGSGSQYGNSPYGTTFAARMIQDVPTLIAMSHSG